MSPSPSPRGWMTRLLLLFWTLHRHTHTRGEPGGRAPQARAVTRGHGPVLRGFMDYGVVDVDEVECRPVFPVRPWAKHQDPLSGSASTGGSSGRGDAAGPPELSFRVYIRSTGRGRAGVFPPTLLVRIAYSGGPNAGVQALRGNKMACVCLCFARFSSSLSQTRPSRNRDTYIKVPRFAEN